MTLSDPAFAALAEHFAVLWRNWSSSSLRQLCSAEGDFFRPSPELMEALVAERAGVGAWLGDALETAGDVGDFRRRPDAFAAREIVRWLRRKNQFFELDQERFDALTADLRAALERARQLLLSELSARDATVALYAWFAAQRDRIAELARAELGPSPRDVVIAEYSPELALGVLGLEPDGLAQPVLDVGCGPSATLVQFLRARGISALGIDRDAAAVLASPVDWLHCDFGVERWGTVLSHLGFSLHFLHHHLKCDDAAFVYARTYMRILRSLKVGGVFAYAPALPFIEELLPESVYARDSGALPEALRGESVIRVERATGLALGTAARIRRISV